MAKRKSKRKILKTSVPKKCYFCDENKEPLFSDVGNLRKYTTERGKIIPRSRSGLCAKHQRHLAEQIKHARHLALMPFVVRV